MEFVAHYPQRPVTPDHGEHDSRDSKAKIGTRNEPLTKLDNPPITISIGEHFPDCRDRDVSGKQDDAQIVQHLEEIERTHKALVAHRAVVCEALFRCLGA